MNYFVNADLDDMIIVDNIICSYCLNIENGIPIKPYSDSNEDYELEFLSRILSKIGDDESTIDFINREFGLDQFYKCLTSSR